METGVKVCKETGSAEQFKSIKEGRVVSPLFGCLLWHEAATGTIGDTLCTVIRRCGQWAVHPYPYCVIGWLRWIDREMSGTMSRSS